MFFAAWSATTLRAALQQPFSLAFWGMSFPLAALAALTLRLAAFRSTHNVSPSQLALEVLALASLALASVVIGWLVWCTVKGLRNGSLLVPEPAPAAATSPASATAPPAP
jgi:tellurite resistance protein